MANRRIRKNEVLNLLTRVQFTCFGKTTTVVSWQNTQCQRSKRLWNKQDTSKRAGFKKQKYIVQV